MKTVRFLLLIILMSIVSSVTYAQTVENGSKVDLTGSYGLELNAQATPSPIDPISTTRIQYHIPYHITANVSVGPYFYIDSKFDFWEVGAIGKWYPRGIKVEGISDYAKLLIAGKEFGSGFRLIAGYGLEYYFNKNMAIGANLNLQMRDDESFRVAPGLNFRIIR